MNTGLLTFYHIHHYGAVLQAYATERAVEALGSRCEIVDYYVNQDNALFPLPNSQQNKKLIKHSLCQLLAD